MTKLTERLNMDRVHIICYSLLLVATTVQMFMVIFVLGGDIERDIADETQCHHRRGEVAFERGSL